MSNKEQSSHIFENLLFPKIFQTFGMAIQPSKLIIGFLTLATISLAGWIMDFSRTVVVTPEHGVRGVAQTELDFYLKSPDNLQRDFIEQYKENGRRRGVFSVLWHFGA